jgi:hypothetical protein
MPVALLLSFALFATSYFSTHSVKLPPGPILALLRISLPGTFVFWIWMAYDHFSQTAVSRSKVWSICLILFNWGAALGYFFAVWRRRHGVIAGT